MPQTTRLKEFFSLRNIGGIYFWLLIIVFFCAYDPGNFPQTATATTILNQYSINAIVALGLIVPMAAGMFDLSIGSIIGFSGTLVAWLLANTSMPYGVAMVITVGAAVLLGVLNSLVIVAFRVDSFIATLGTGSIIAALTVGVSGNQDITKRVGGAFAEDVAQRSFGGLTLPVLYMFVLMLLLAYLLEKTPAGRYWYAIGFDADTARLAGLRVQLLQSVSLLISAALAGFAGIVTTARIGASSPSVGPEYLLPAFAAAFLGATQFRGGRFNAWGTVAAVLLIGTGEYGILLSGAPLWAPNVFDGVALIAAVAFTMLTFGKRFRFARYRRGAPPGPRRDRPT